MEKVIIYQVFTRLYGNRNTTRQENGTIEENGCGKMADFSSEVLKDIAQTLTLLKAWGKTVLGAVVVD